MERNEQTPVVHPPAPNPIRTRSAHDQREITMTRKQSKTNPDLIAELRAAEAAEEAKHVGDYDILVNSIAGGTPPTSTWCSARFEQRAGLPTNSTAMSGW